MTRSWTISASPATIRSHHQQLRRYFRERTPRSVDVDDLVSTTWLEAGRSFAHRCTLRYYLFVIARRVLASALRRRSRLVLDGTDFDELPTQLRSPSSEMLVRDLQARVAHALAQVEEPFVGVVALWLKGWDSVSIARQLGVNYNTVRSRLVRGKKQLDAALISASTPGC
ncbi:ECF RNA polymerase sigma factor SigE [Enhygromyxa salina]|uniref:ECF RNA polymerase sigma factor SigE n=1 Tax=Enhygromyxa salina TaxID=215803 RepID=A0A2S9YBL7_9BACT|nr:sigma-70 family RNA polymerase sigma factor [Enhygromyxa salina]PRQ02493.1 ECF RNA polymerase sigma factor SigE [Enhygromyxa salina]